LTEREVCHAVDGRLDQQDRRHQIGHEAGKPLRFVEIAEIAGRGPSGIGDQDVRLRTGFQQGFATCFLGDIGDDGRDTAFGRFANRRCGGHHLGFVAAVDNDVDTFPRQRFRAAPAKTLTRGAHDRAASGYSEIHDVTPAIDEL